MTAKPNEETGRTRKTGTRETGETRETGDRPRFLPISFNGRQPSPSQRFASGPSLSRKRARGFLVQAWVAIHEDELMADWTLAVNGEPVFPIDPLR